MPLFLKQIERNILAAADLLEKWFSIEERYVKNLDEESKIDWNSFHPQQQSIIHKEIMWIYKIFTYKINDKPIRYRFNMEISSR